jgi:PiT family inorganic phosphate transporter
LIEAFSGKGLVPAELTMQPAFLFAVGGGAALTVMFASLAGMPVSTTHALVGALVGAGLAYAGQVDPGQLVQGFFVPLAFSPLIAVALTGVLYLALHKLRTWLGVEFQLCICVDNGDEPVACDGSGALVYHRTGARISAGEMDSCRERYLLNGSTTLIGIDVQKVVDVLHFLSAGMVGFARGLNDTPKIVALLLGANLAGISMTMAMLAVGFAIAAGGLLNARRVAATMSEKIVPMNHGQGLTANLVTAFLVIVASRFGVPVSTTHVSVGSLFGLGAVTGEGRWNVFGAIIGAWIVTLPLAAVLAASIALID